MIPEFPAAKTFKILSSLERFIKSSVFLPAAYKMISLSILVLFFHCLGKYKSDFKSSNKFLYL